MSSNEKERKKCINIHSDWMRNVGQFDSERKSYDLETERKPGRDHLLTRFRDDSAVEISVTFKYETKISS